MTNNPLAFLIDLFFPRQDADFTRIDSYLSQAKILEIFNFSNKTVSIGENNLDSAYHCVSYKDTQIEALIHRAKFQGEIAICETLVEILLLPFQKNLLECPSVISFVPPDPDRVLKRGYHIPKILAEILAKNLKTNFVSVATKQKATVAQTELNRIDRLNNLKDVFSLNKGMNFNEGESLFVIDDVITTGSTLNEVSKTIKKSFPNLKIIALTVAG